MCQAIENALATVGMGENIPDEIDFLVVAMDALIDDDLDRKMRRNRRFESTKSKKSRIKAQYMMYGEPDHYSNKACFNNGGDQIVPVFHSKDKPVAFIKKGRRDEATKLLHKQNNRRLRHQRFYEDRDMLDECNVDECNVDDRNIDDDIAFQESLYDLTEEELFQMGFVFVGRSYVFDGFYFDDVRIGDLCKNFFNDYEESIWEKINSFYAKRRDLLNLIDDIKHQLNDIDAQIKNLHW